ncbi:MAG: hypothetical protein IJ861_01040 [Clostridia bacterium]|nr:hypothetical protein [Clostridia bacterium]
MKLKFNVEYNEEEMAFIKSHDCEIISEIKLSKTDFSENEIPKRMIKYGDSYIGEIIDDEDGSLVWGVLGKGRKGIWHFMSEYDSLKSMAEGI